MRAYYNSERDISVKYSRRPPYKDKKKKLFLRFVLEWPVKSISCQSSLVESPTCLSAMFFSK